MRHVFGKGVEQLRDSDAVSAMLTAIQDFIKDSFSVNEHDYLDTVEVGSYTVFLTRDTHAVLACVTQGIAPYSLRETFDNALQDVNKNYNDELKNFDGDSSTLEPVDQVLQSCLLSEKKDEFEKKDPSIKNLVLLLVLIVAGLSYWRYDFWQFQKRAQSYIAHLQQTVGIVIANYDYDGKHLIIEGLYDPLAENPQHSVEQFGLQSQDVSGHWQVYQSLEPFFLQQRLTSLLLPPNTVVLKVENNKLMLAGAADSDWINNLALFKPFQIGVKAIDTRGLKTYQQAIFGIIQPPPTVTLSYQKGYLLLQGTASLSWIQTLPEKLTPLPFLESYDIKNLVTDEEIQFQQLVTKLEDSFIYFANGKATPKNVDTEYIRYMTKMMRELQKLSVQLNKPIELVITGHTDSSGSRKFNQTLAQKRADYMIEQLGLQGISVNLKKATKTSANKKIIGDLERKISLKIIYTGTEQ
jgi:flagellar motor protein MotB